jgi:hypothetical protein
MDKKMGMSEQILEEIKRYNKINNYIVEQAAETPDVPSPEGAETPPPTTAPDAAGAPLDTPPSGESEPTTVDVANDPDVEKVGDEGEEETGSEELEITDLVKSQKNIETKQEEYFNNLFSQLSNLEQKLSDMDQVMNKLNDLETKIEKYRPKTNQEKLELRSLDSGPYNQKLTDFFTDKQQDIQKSGKNEYVLTQDEVEDYNPSDIKRSFRNFEDEGQQFTQIR